MAVPLVVDEPLDVTLTMVEALYLDKSSIQYIGMRTFKSERKLTD